MGHRVYGHESKCANLHGHNYRFHFTVRKKPFDYRGENGLDDIGRVIDFSVIKEMLCQWLEKNWDHKMMLWEQDPFINDLVFVNNQYSADIVFISVPFNPTAENIAEYFLKTIAPQLLEQSGVYLYSLKLDETAKCSAIVTLSDEEVKQASIQAVKFPIDQHYCHMGNNNCDCIKNNILVEEMKNCRNLELDLPF